MISKEEFQARRLKLAQALPRGAVAIIPGAAKARRNGDVTYRFRQDSSFYYLTGFNEPDALLVIVAGDGFESILFNHAHDPKHAIWEGKRLGQADAMSVLGVDSAYPLSDCDEKLAQLLKNREAIYYPVGCHPLWEARLLSHQAALQNISPFLAEMRLIKSEAELQCMQKAVQVSTDAHRRAMRAVRQVHYEYELEAELVYETLRQGCSSFAYDAIVAAGANACTLHYTDNNQPFKSTDLILIDAGAEFLGYAADITRTFPASGHYNTHARALYELVFQAQQRAMALVSPGLPWNQLQEAVVHELTKGLLDLGILNGTLETLIETEAYKPFYMHNSGHWLGLDVHDVGAYQRDGKPRPLEAHMVLTIEPGLYIAPETQGIDPGFCGIGIRIEDDILVTETGFLNLSADLESRIDLVEALISG